MLVKIQLSNNKINRILPLGRKPINPLKLNNENTNIAIIGHKRIKTTMEQLRFFSSSKLRKLPDPALQLNKKQSSAAPLDPHWVTGFTDGEGCFHVSITENKKLKEGWRVRLFFQINLHEKDKSLLELIQNYLIVGSITKGSKQGISFVVVSIKKLQAIINHFDRVPLISQKSADYLLFKHAYELMLAKEHLTENGFRKIVAIKATMNRGLPAELQTAFPDVVPVTRPLVKNKKVKDPSPLRGLGSPPRRGGAILID